MIANEFYERFGRDGAATGKAPGRVNLIGEHTDYNGGAVLPTALNCCVEVVIAPGAQSAHRIHSTEYQETITRPVGDAATGHWSDYVAGGLHVAEQYGLIGGAVDISIGSNIPPGAGVSSSAALITAVLRACSELAGIKMEAVKVAEMARAVENTYIGMPCGIMDQMAVALTLPGQALALDTEDLSFEVINIPESFQFITLHSGITRKLSDGRYAQRFEECQRAKNILGTENLCNAPLHLIEKLDDVSLTLLRRARHVYNDNIHTKSAVKALRDGDIVEFGSLMNKSHASYSGDFEASTPEIDAMTAYALEAGALGSRLTGGGFGGCFVSLVKIGTGDLFMSAMQDRFSDIRLIG